MQLRHPHPMCRVRCHRWLRPIRRRWPLWLLLLGILVLVTTRFVEIKQVALTLVQGQWQWMLAAVLLQGGYYTVYAALYQAGFATVGVASGVVQLIPVLFASIFVGTVAPAGGVSAAAVLIEDAARREQPAARAAEGVLLVWVAGLGALVPLLFLGLGYLSAQGALRAYQAIGALVFLVYVGALTGMLLLAMWRPGRLRHLLRWLQARLNRVLARLRRPPLPDDWARKNAAESTGAAIAVARHPYRVGKTLMVGLAAHLVNLACLYAIFLAFEHAIGVAALASGYALGYVFSIISIVPFDLGVVEGIMALVFASLGVPAAGAVVIALAFRGLNAWLPIALSFFLFRVAWHPDDRHEG